jgi:hypothetical protein
MHIKYLLLLRKKERLHNEKVNIVFNRLYYPTHIIEKYLHIYIYIIYQPFYSIRLTQFILIISNYQFETKQVIIPTTRVYFPSLTMHRFRSIWSNTEPMGPTHELSAQYRFLRRGRSTIARLGSRQNINRNTNLDSVS